MVVVSTEGVFSGFHHMDLHSLPQHQPALFPPSRIPPFFLSFLFFSPPTPLHSHRSPTVGEFHFFSLSLFFFLPQFYCSSFIERSAELGSNRSESSNPSRTLFQRPCSFTSYISQPLDSMTISVSHSIYLYIYSGRRALSILCDKKKKLYINQHEKKMRKKLKIKEKKFTCSSME